MAWLSSHWLFEDFKELPTRCLFKQVCIFQASPHPSRQKSLGDSRVTDLTKLKMSQNVDSSQWATLQQDLDRENLASVPLFTSPRAEDYFGERDPLGKGDAVRGARIYIEMLDHMDRDSAERWGRRLPRRWYQRELDARALIRTEERLGPLDTAYNAARAEKAAKEAQEDKRPGMERLMPVEYYRITERTQKDAKITTLQSEAGRLKMFLKTMEDEKSDDMNVEMDDDSLFNDSMFEEPPSDLGGASGGKWAELERMARIAQGLPPVDEGAQADAKDSDDVPRGRKGKGKDRQN